MDAKAINIINETKDKLRDGTRWWSLKRTEQLLYILRDGKWHFDTELADNVGWRFGAAVYNLRHEYGIEVERRLEEKPREGKRRRNQYRVA